MPVYASNSREKEIVRARWVHFSKEITRRKSANVSEFSFMTLPSEEIQDVLLYKDEGLLEFDVTESGLGLVRGKLVCVEQNSNKFKTICERLSNAVFLNNDVFSVIKSEQKRFPFDTINLDFDGRISETSYPIEDAINRIFILQKESAHSFSLYITCPITEDEDPQTFKDVLVSKIINNVNDRSNQNFRDLFVSKFSAGLEGMTYEDRLLVGLNKMIIEASSKHKFRVNICEFYKYGGTLTNRQRMLSLIFDFVYVADQQILHTDLYYQDRVFALNSCEDLTLRLQTDNTTQS